MINLIYSPQRADIKAKYTVSGDVLTVTIDDGVLSTTEIFDFTGLEEGVAEDIIVEVLPINPVISAEKVGDIVTITVIRFYNADEKYLFEGDIDG